MSNFKDAKAKARQRKITDAQRTAAKKDKILVGFQCPHKRCMFIITMADFKVAPNEAACVRCASSIEDFTPLFADHRKIVPEDILKHDKS